MKRIQILSSFLLLLLVLAASGCRQSDKHQPSSQQTEEPRPVHLAQVAAMAVTDQVEIMGNIQASLESVISPRISGTVVKINVAPGSQVKKGDILVEISAGELSAQLLQAKAELDQAKRNLTREKKLLMQNASTPETVKELQDLQNIAQAGYEEAKIMLSYTTITAPFDGQITKKLTDVGELASPAAPLLNIENDTQLQVIADIPESLAQNITLGMQMLITVPSAQITTKGTVSEMTPVADAITRTVPIKLNIIREKGLHSGQFARVTLPGKTVKTMIVPPEAIHFEGQLEKVFVAIDHTARLRLIRSGKSYPEGTEVLTGLHPGDQLITSGEGNLFDGQRITY